MTATPIFKRRPGTSESELVRIRPTLQNSPIPMMVECLDKDVDTFTWLHANRAVVEEQLSGTGAVLIRGFPLNLPSDFERLAETVSPNLITDYGDLPRGQEGGRLYGSTVYPAAEQILYHNESSHEHRWPMHISFCCMRAATSGGETPLVDCREVLRRLPVDVRMSFQRDGLLYVRNFVSGLDVGWEHFFGTSNQREVEERCARANTECLWQEGGLRTRRRAPAIAQHPWTGDLTFFNQILLHHIAMLHDDVRISLISLFGESGLPRNVLYGSGDPIADDLVRQIRCIYDELAVEFPWEEGDVIMLDNMQIAHGRRAFSGDRKILVTMAEAMDLSSLSRSRPTGGGNVTEVHHG
jgi:alpha-ketoglutarate-dependent taurine dioxygenase